MAWMRMQINNHIKTAGFPVSVDILFPEHRRDTGEKVKTLYLLHGYHGDRTDWLLKTNLVRKIEGYPLAVVLVDGLNSYYVNLPSAHYYSDYVSQELPAYLEGILPLSDSRADRFVAGAGMGGYGAFRQAFNHPETFGVAASFSGEMDIESLYEERKTTIPPEHLFGPREMLSESGNDLFLEAKAAAGRKALLPCLLQICGTGDSLLETNRKFAGLLKEQKIPVVYEEADGGHDWDFWEKCLDRLLDFLK